MFLCLYKKIEHCAHQLHKGQCKAVAAAPNGLTCQEHMLERLMPGHTQSMSTQRYGHTWEICEMSEAMPGASCNQSFPTNSTLQCPAKRCKKCLRRVTVMRAAHKVDAKEICVKSFKSHFQNRSIFGHSLSHKKFKIYFQTARNCQSHIHINTHHLGIECTKGTDNASPGPALQDVWERPQKGCKI